MESFKNTVSKNIGTTPVSLMTASATAVLVGCNVANLVTVDLPVDIWIDRAGTVVYLIKAGRVTASKNFEVIQGKTVLEVGDVLKAVATTPNAFDIILSYLSGVN